MTDYQHIIDKYYPAGNPAREILLRHSRQVAEMALGIARDCRLPIDETDIEAAAMLHDIGIFMTNAPSIGCHGDAPYIAHGTLGAGLLRREGVDERLARVAERHTGSGLTAQEIAVQHLPLPPHDLLPETLLEKLICYADKFFSKGGDMTQKSFDTVRSSLARHGAATLARFDALAALFRW